MPSPVERPAQAPARSIGVGDALPPLRLTDHAGAVVETASLRGRWVVLFFFPKDFTPGCTAQACAMRDGYEEFARLGAVVIGVSSDTPERHRTFASWLGLPFHLISDAGGQLRRELGVPRTLWVIPGRVTYVVDPSGVVRHVFNSQMRFGAHVRQALETIRAGAGGAGGAGGTRVDEGS
ncbi:MAG: peroxiredoxin [Planctomyces sp.]|nr:peroxiredoxin [Planctomyces sp.]MBA4120826.1 peroxiredoxin [Isosphaera sp.]